MRVPGLFSHLDDSPSVPGLPYRILRCMLVLAIEDDPAILRLLERGLTAYGYDFASAEDGELGATRALEADVELVLLDISLPGIDGYEVLERIRSERPGLPVLMLSAR